MTQVVIRNGKLDIIEKNERLHFHFSRFYTKMAKRLFGAFGPDSILYYPSRIHNPKKIFIGSAVLLQSHIWLNAVDKWLDTEYDGEIHIHDEACIMNHVQISAISRITIGKLTGIGRNSVIVDHYHDYTRVDTPIMRAPLSAPKPVTIEDDVFVGVNCVIAPGVTIGRHSFIAANSVVNRDIPPYSFAAGSPARVLRTYDHQAGAWKNPQQDAS